MNYMPSAPLRFTAVSEPGRGDLAKDRLRPAQGLCPQQDTGQVDPRCR